MESWVYTPPSNMAPVPPSPPLWRPPVEAPVRSVTGLRPKVQDRPAYYGVLIKVIGAGVLGYHGYRRTRGSLWWTAGWAALGAFSPVLGGLIASLQGFGKRPSKE